MRSRWAFVVPIIAVLFAATAVAKPRKPVETDAPPEPIPAVPAPKASPGLAPLFTTLPMAISVPKGLANASAQGCNACHYDAHDGWAGSRHATAAGLPVFTAAVAAAADPQCTSCHLPLAAQHEGPAYDATLALEGVTCAACHVRDGKIVATSPEAADRAAPHPMTWSPELTASEGCATCHQLTWTGADRPLYDTYGEWKASSYAKAGVDCQDCHGGVGADGRLGSDHAFPADPARAVSVLVQIPEARVVRGGDPLPVTVLVQNTGAGHSFPTGTPWKWVRVDAAIWGPVGKNGARGVVAGTEHSAELRRTVEPTAPFRTTADTRILAGGEQTWDWPMTLPQTTAPGRFTLEVTLSEVLEGQPPTMFASQVIPLRVE